MYIHHHQERSVRIRLGWRSLRFHTRKQRSRGLDHFRGISAGDAVLGHLNQAHHFSSDPEKHPEHSGVVSKSSISTVSTKAIAELKYSAFCSQRSMGFLPLWTPASIGLSVATSTGLYLAHDDVRFSSTEANAGNAYASHRRHVLKKKRYHFRPLPRAGWVTDSPAPPLPGPAHGLTAGSALFSERGTFSHQCAVCVGRRRLVSFAVSTRSLFQFRRASVQVATVPAVRNCKSPSNSGQWLLHSHIPA